MLWIVKLTIRHKLGGPLRMSKSIVKLLLEHERAIAKFYTICAKMFPQYSSFWQELAGEEVRHTKIIETVLQKVDEKTCL